MYSQRDEELHITSYFGDRVGTFLDIGAYDGITFSNTLRLVEQGWFGVCVEPDPKAFDALRRRHASNDRIQLIEAALAAEDCPVQLFSSGGDAVSTTSEQHREKWKASSGVKFEPVAVDGLSISSICSRSGIGLFNFINLDVEGTNWELLKTMPLLWLGCELICVEMDDNAPEIVAYCAAQGLKHIIAKTHENLLIGKRAR